jgi:hypothetical protein
MFKSTTTGIFFILFGLSGCVSHNTIAPEIALAPSSITQKQSQYSNALERLGEMMETYGDTVIAMTVPPVINETGGIGQGTLPQNVTMMVESALQNIGAQVLVMPHGKTSIQLAFAKGTPPFSIRGAITEFDAQTTGKRSGGQIGVYYKDADLGAESEAELASGTLAIDFLVLDNATNAYCPGVKVSVKATIQKQSENRGFSFSILGNGFGVSGSTSVQTPVHHVLNLMIEYSMVQLVGQMMNYPYWIAIQGSDPDYRMVRKLGKSFSKKPNERKVTLITFLLNKIDPTIAPSQTGKLNTQHKTKIIELKKYFEISPADSKITTEFYTTLISDGTMLIRRQEVMGQANEALNQMF